MIYMIGYFVAFFGLIIMLVGFKDFYSKINKMNRFGFICLCLGLILPMIYGFVSGFVSGFINSF